MKKILCTLLLLLLLSGGLWWIVYQVSNLPTGNYFPETEEEINEDESYP